RPKSAWVVIGQLSVVNSRWVVARTTFEREGVGSRFRDEADGWNGKRAPSRNRLPTPFRTIAIIISSGPEPDEAEVGFGGYGARSCLWKILLAMSMYEWTGPISNSTRVRSEPIVIRGSPPSRGTQGSPRLSASALSRVATASCDERCE